MAGILQETVMNERLIIRFGSMLAIAAILFPLIWSASYHLLPEGFMRGKTPTESIIGSEVSTSFMGEWIEIAGFNMLAVLLIIALNLVFWLDLIPLGYIYPFGQIILYAIFIGTNSFFIPMPERMAPSFAILYRAGPYEMIGFLLVAASTYNQSRYALTHDSHWINRPVMKKEQWVGLISGIILILLAGLLESLMIHRL